MAPVSPVACWQPAPVVSELSAEAVSMFLRLSCFKGSAGKLLTCLSHVPLEKNKKKKKGRDNSRDKTLLVEESTKPFRHFFLKIWVVPVQEPSFRGQRRECADLSDAGWERSGKGSPISWVNWQVWWWMNQHLMWQWKAWSSLAFGRLLWVSSLRVQAFAWDIKGAVVTLSPQIPWHNSPARHSCEGMSVLQPSTVPQECVCFGNAFYVALLTPWTITVWELGGQLLLLGSAA